MTEDQSGRGVRLDKWLWAARFFKTRTLAKKAIEGGHVRVNGDRIKPGRIVQSGLMIRVRKGQTELIVEVVALADKRGPASVAQTLYEETDESKKARKELAEQRKLAGAANPVPLHRPSKKERRQLEKFLRDNYRE